MVQKASITHSPSMTLTLFLGQLIARRRRSHPLQVCLHNPHPVFPTLIRTRLPFPHLTSDGPRFQRSTFRHNRNSRQELRGAAVEGGRGMAEHIPISTHPDRSRRRSAVARFIALIHDISELLPDVMLERKHEGFSVDMNKLFMLSLVSVLFYVSIRKCMKLRCMRLL